MYPPQNYPLYSKIPPPPPLLPPAVLPRRDRPNYEFSRGSRKPSRGRGVGLPAGRPKERPQAAPGRVNNEAEGERGAAREERESAAGRGTARNPRAGSAHPARGRGPFSRFPSSRSQSRGGSGASPLARLIFHADSASGNFFGLVARPGRR